MQDNVSKWVAVISAILLLAMSWYIHLNYDYLDSTYHRPGYKNVQFLYDESFDFIIFAWGYSLKRVYYLDKLASCVFRYMMDIALVNMFFDYTTNPSIYNMSKMWNMAIVHGFFLFHLLLIWKFKNSKLVKILRL